MYPLDSEKRISTHPMDLVRERSRRIDSMLGCTLEDSLGSMGIDSTKCIMYRGKRVYTSVCHALLEEGYVLYNS